jgi:hypothetical protein
LFSVPIPAADVVDSQSTSEDEETDSADSGDSDEAEALYSITMRVRGATYEENQVTVKNVRSSGPDFLTTSVRLELLPTNVKNNNAIMFQVVFCIY